MPRMFAIGPTQTGRRCQELRRRFDLSLKHVEERALSSRLLRAREKCLRCPFPQDCLAARPTEPATKSQHARTSAPCTLEPCRKVFAPEVLRRQRGAVEQLASRVVLVRHEPGGLLERRKRAFPVSSVDQAPAPRPEIVGALRRPRDLCQPARSIHALDDLAHPSVLVRVPVAIAVPAGFCAMSARHAGRKSLRPGSGSTATRSSSWMGSQKCPRPFTSAIAARTAAARSAGGES